jgi:hypothetical protein
MSFRQNYQWLIFWKDVQWRINIKSCNERRFGTDDDWTEQFEKRHNCPNNMKLHIELKKAK